jgi:hypothetical protein
MDKIQLIGFFDYREVKCKLIFHHKELGYVEINPDRLSYEETELPWNKATELRDFLIKCIDSWAPKIDCPNNLLEP